MKEIISFYPINGTAYGYLIHRTGMQFEISYAKRLNDDDEFDVQGRSRTNGKSHVYDTLELATSVVKKQLLPLSEKYGHNI